MSAAYYSLHGNAPWRTSCDDAFLIACRKIHDFLTYNKRSMKQGQELPDVLAIDYLPESYKRSWDLPIWNAEWKDAMDKQLAHISYLRDKEWNHQIWVPKLESEFNNAWWDFREAIIDEDYNKEFDSQLANCRKKSGFQNIALRRR